MSLIVVKETQAYPMFINGVFTVHTVDASEKCRCSQGKVEACLGISIDHIALASRNLQLCAQVATKDFVKGVESYGYRYTGRPVVLHGPFPSMDFEHSIMDTKSLSFNEAKQGQGAIKGEDPSKVLYMVFDRQMVNNPLSDYVLVGEFYADEHFVRTSMTERER